jgi:hypothetical protein
MIQFVLGMIIGAVFREEILHVVDLIVTKVQAL